MKLAEFNSLDQAAATAVIRPCADIDRWVDAVVSARPYSNVEELITVARDAAADWTNEEIDGALAHHPRIGQRAAGSSTEAAMSRAEQAGVDAHDADIQAELAQGNARYEERFGRVFLIRAAGRKAPEILAELRRRLANSPEQEIAETGIQLREIALLRLEGVFNS